MVFRSASPVSAAPGPNLGVVGGRRGVAETVTIRRTLALEPALEGMSLAHEVIRACVGIQVAAATNQQAAVIEQAGRLGHHAMSTMAELRRLAERIDR